MKNVDFISFLLLNLLIVKGCYSLALLYNASSDTGEVYNNSNLIESYYSITCCRNGYPIPDPSIAPYIQEWTQQLAGPVPSGANVTCNRYVGQYSLPYGWTTNNKDVTVGVRCQCPEEHLDRNCRYLPDCENSGYRSFSINLRCVCPPQYFGELCEKYCLNGELVKNAYLIDQCVCGRYFYGDSCEHITCFNGGTPVNGRGCSCQIPYVGLHCETRLNGTNEDGSQSHHENLHRDLSGSMISLFLVTAAAILAFYIIRRYRRLRRNAVARSTLVTEIGGPTTRPGMYTNAAMQQSIPSGEFGQPPTNPPSYHLNEFPPLPKYSDVVKSSPPPYIASETVVANDGHPTVNSQSEPSERNNPNPTENL